MASSNTASDETEEVNKKQWQSKETTQWCQLTWLPGPRPAACVAVLFLISKRRWFQFIRLVRTGKPKLMAQYFNCSFISRLSFQWNCPSVSNIIINNDALSAEHYMAMFGRPSKQHELYGVWLQHVWSWRQGGGWTLIVHQWISFSPQTASKKWENKVGEDGGEKRRGREKGKRANHYMWHACMCRQQKHGDSPPPLFTHPSSRDASENWEGITWWLYPGPRLLSDFPTFERVLTALQKRKQ